MDKLLFNENTSPSAARLNSSHSESKFSTINRDAKSPAVTSSSVDKKSDTVELQPASFSRQLRVLAWKSILITRRNFIHFLFEIILSFLFVFMLIVVRYFVERIFYEEQASSAYNVVDFFYKYIGQDTIVFYPDTPVVKNVINRALKFLKSQKYWLSIHSNFKLVTQILKFIVNYSYALKLLEEMSRTRGVLIRRPWTT
jgi:hypothetical protein